jgi:membrane protein
MRARAIDWSKAKAGSAGAWAVEARETHASVDVGFRLAERDKRVAAGVLAGGIAYRFFFWFLSVALVVIGALGLGNSGRVQSALREAGVGSSLTGAVDDVSQQSQAVDWSLLIIGSWLVLWTGYTCAKALVLVHATVWDVPPPPLANALKASLAFTGAAVGFIAAMSGARWLRAETATPGLIATLALIVVPFALWLSVARRLPHREVGWRELVPDALVVAAGVQALHLFTTLFLGPKLANATELYGALGIATTILFWFYLVGRLVLAGAMLSASLDDQRSGVERA